MARQHLKITLTVAAIAFIGLAAVCTAQGIEMKRPPMTMLQSKAPDLIVTAIDAPATAAPGQSLGTVKVTAKNIGAAMAPGTAESGGSDHGYMIDLVISTDTSVPMGWATYSPNYSEDVLLQGGRISNTPDLDPSESEALSEGGMNLQSDVPPGYYHLCARIDPGNKVPESNENNNLYCVRLTVKPVPSTKNPVITGYRPAGKCIPRGSAYWVVGHDFGATQGARGVALGGHGIHIDLTILSWSDTAIHVQMPNDSSIQLGQWYYNGIEKSTHDAWLSNISENITICPQGRPAVPGGVAIPRPMPGREDCVSLNPKTSSVGLIGGHYKVVDGSHWLFDFGATAQGKTEAYQTLRIIQFYGMTQSCFVGRPDPSFHYMLVNGASPTGAYSAEDCVAFNPATASVQNVSGSWKIVDGSHWMFDFGSKKSEAMTSLAIIQKYGFTRSCFVGRPGPNFTYLRK